MASLENAAGQPDSGLRNRAHLSTKQHAGSSDTLQEASSTDQTTTTVPDNDDKKQTSQKPDSSLPHKVLGRTADGTGEFLTAQTTRSAQRHKLSRGKPTRRLSLPSPPPPPTLLPLLPVPFRPFAPISSFSSCPNA